MPIVWKGSNLFYLFQVKNGDMHLFKGKDKKRVILDAADDLKLH